MIRCARTAVIATAGHWGIGSGIAGLGGMLLVVTGMVAFGMGARTALAGEYNQVLSVGDSAPTWDGLIGVDDKPHSLAELEDNKLVVVVFTCNSCPYAVDAEERLIALQAKYGKRGVALIAINANKVEEDLLPAMKEKAADKGFEFPYLFDETQQVARAFGAMVTPECFVLDEDRRVRYMGSIDDSPDGRKVSKKYLELAIDAVLAGDDPELGETVPIGCRVRYDRQRRSRRKPATQD
jgi:peroxiredoxin